jgi:serine phosphatase RsbU (regulator of sigma subunit)
MKLRTAAVILLFSLMLIPTVMHAQQPYQAKSGVLDLSGVDFDKTGLISLDGEWNYTFGKLIYPSASPTEWETNFTLPAPWNGTLYRGKVLSEYGCASYRLNLVLPRDFDSICGFKITPICLSYRFFVNGKLVSHSGIPSEHRITYHPEWKPDTIVLRMQPGTNELVFQAANYDHVHGGIEYSILFGNAAQIVANHESLMGTDLFLIGVLIIMGIYHLALFALRRKDFSALYFGIFCLLIALRTSVTGEKILEQMLPSIPFEVTTKFEYIPIPMCMYFFQVYMNVLFPAEVLSFQKWISEGSSILVFFLVLLFPQKIYGHIFPWYNLLMVAVMVLMLIMLVRAVLKKREGSYILSAGFLFIAVTMLNDILYVNQFIATGYYIPLGVFMFIFSQSFLLSQRFSKAFVKVEVMGDQLSLYSQDLEKQVQERTSELSGERNRLRQRNSEMESELVLAREIQTSFIPSGNSMEHVAWFYRPMEAVGGDFFDFIHYADPDVLGVFISDVSGHGVPAALVTSMIKSSLLQAAPNINDPAYLMEYMNEALLNRTAGHFVTAFYGIWNRKKREFLFCNAGHNCPFLLLGANRTEGIVCRESGLPLAVLENKLLAENSKPYRNETMSLPAGSRLLLYTDGLIETVRLSDIGKKGELEEFGTNELPKALRELQPLPGTAFVEALAERLIRYRGSERFDDDVCIVCLEA